MIDHNFEKQSVKTFWQGVNWENCPIVTNQSQTLTVQDYFAMIPWSGVAIAQSNSKPLPSQKPSQSSIKSDTLEDFLNDIKFF